MATIKSKLIANATVTLLLVLALLGFQYYHLHGVRVLQDAGAKRYEDALLTGKGARVGLAMYGVIADAVINRNLDDSAKKWTEVKAESLKVLEDVEKTSDTPQEKEWTAQAKKAAGEVIDIYENKELPLLKSTPGLSKEISDLDDAIDQRVKVIQENLAKVDDSIRKEAADVDKEFDMSCTKAIVASLIVGLLGVMIQVGLASWLLRSVLRPVNAMVVMFQDMAQGEGDLTRRLDDGSKDEIAAASRYFNLFMGKLHAIISTFAANTSQVAAAAAQLTATAGRIATGAEEVAAQAGTVATAGEEMAATSGDIARNCQMAAEGSSQANRAALAGSEVVNNTVQVMGMIASRVQGTAAAVHSLGQRSDQIGEIVATIQDIADQTNLLALNAAIEAARAGEQGRGFAVVADEVRALAERTMRATREIGEMIRGIQAETKDAVTAMEAGVLEVEKGTAEAAKSGGALREILAQIDAVAQQINQVATAAEEQTATTGEISSNIHMITEVVQATAHDAQDSAGAARQLAATAEELQKVVRQFRL